MFSMSIYFLVVGKAVETLEDDAALAEDVAEVASKVALANLHCRMCLCYSWAFRSSSWFTFDEIGTHVRTIVVF